MTGEAMATVIKVVYEDGVLKPEGPVELQEKGHYVARLEPAPKQIESQDDDDPTGWKAIDSLVGIIKDAPPDLAENHDKYLYGEPDE